jgi:hypothetical protein
MEAFLAAEARAAREHLSALLVITAVGSQSDRSGIERLQRELEREV